MVVQVKTERSWATVNVVSGFPGGTTTATGNRPPEINPPRAFVIPNATAFTLTASGADPDGDLIQWAFDQHDLGPAASLADPDNGQRPIFRFQAPSASPDRFFPELDALLRNASAKEKFPS